MIIICGKTIAEVERDLEMAKQAIASGMPYGIGGETVEDVEQAMDMLSAITDNSALPKSCGCSCDHCDGCCDDDGICYGCGVCEDEDEPCEDCEGECEDEDGLSEIDIDRIAEAVGIPKTLVDLIRQELGL
jgi:hypothetical protein